MKIEQRAYVRKGRKYSPGEIIPRIMKALIREREDLDGDAIGFSSQRLKTYLKGTVCVNCGFKGSFFAKEKDLKTRDEVYHLNFYGVLPDGTEVMMTSDHIVPRSRGGGNGFDNRQPMCQPCNGRKGDSMSEEGKAA